MDSLPTEQLTDHSRKHRIPERIDSHEQVQPFGTSLLPDRYARGKVEGFAIPKDRLETRAKLRATAPNSPGIYGYFDSNGQIQYIGKSKCLRLRLLSYFAKIPPDDKMSRIVQHSMFLRWEPVSHELLALIREQELISRFRPSYNRQGQPERKQPAFLCISDRDAGHAFVQSKISPRSRNCFGPIAGARRLRQTAEDLNHVFRLRDCNDQTEMRFNDQLELFSIPSQAGCIRYEIGSCSGPCTGKLFRQDYTEQITQLTGFLEGAPNDVLQRLRKRMVQMSARQAFEKATMLRDQIQNLNWLSNRLDDLRRARFELNCIYPLPGFRRRRIWLCLTSGLVASAFPNPASRRMAESIHREIRIHEAAASIVLPQQPTTILMQLIVAAWFRKHPTEKENLMSFSAALNQCEKRLTA